MKKYIQVLSILAILFLLAPNLQAQPGFDDEPIDTPIDGGIVVLAAAGLVVGIQKIRNKR
ncbi:MAG: hypothetical protein CFE21_08205 [Bacteroidetes bacterium B1(2017)]|nr:MAG: hypothetical protein CFE21_08205 [Bacteroidetes bacterium B1(2017)]